MPETNTSGNASEELHDSTNETDDSQATASEELHDDGQTGEISDASINDLSEAELEAIISGEPLPGQEEENQGEESKGTAIDNKTTEEEQDNQGDDSPGEKPGKETTVTDDSETGPGQESTPKRIHLGKLETEDAAKVAHIVNGVRDGVYPSVEAAVAAIYPGKAGESVQAVTDAAKAEASDESDTTPVIPEAVAQVDAEIADLRAQRKKAKSEYDTDAEAELQDQIEDMLLEKQRVERDVESAQYEQFTYTDAFNNTVQSVVKAFPRLNDEGDKLTQRVQELRDLAEHRDDPIMDDPTFLEKMANQAAKELGINSQGKPESGQVTTPAAKQARPVGAVASGIEGFGNLSKNDALRAVGELTAEQLERVVESTY